MTFSTINLTGERVLVRGTDIHGVDGETTLDASQWNELSVRKDVQDAEEQFAAAVEEFFAPIVEAAEKAKSSVKKPTDNIGFVVIQEPEEAKAGKPGHVVHLTRDSIVLRLIESGNTDRLIWVNGELEVTEASVAPTPSAPAAAVAEDVVAGDPTPES